MMKDENYFSWDNFDEIADINSHLTFIDETINRYEWDEEIKQGLEKKLKKIREKQQDKKLNLSVIGEFSTGKSTFINALLRMELLVSGALQGTTSVPAVIEYSPKYSISLDFENGERQEIMCCELEELRERITEYTAKEEYAGSLKGVNIGLPSEVLADGFRIIDTPGTNADIAWHEIVTARALKDCSDTSVILTDINRALPQTLLEFIGGNLSSLLEQCIFVATKCDAVRGKKEEKGQQIDQILAYMETKLHSEFDLSHPLILPYAAQDMIYAYTGEAVPDDELVELSRQTEKMIFSYLLKTRHYIQIKKLIVLMDELCEAISGQMKMLSDDYEKELEIMYRSEHVDLTTFLNAQKEERIAGFYIFAKAKRREFADEIYACMLRAVHEIMDKFDELDSIKDMQSFIRQDLLSLYQIKISKVSEEMKETNEAMKYSFQDAYREEMVNFLNSFEQMFADMGIMRVEFSPKEIGKGNDISIDLTEVYGVIRSIEKEISDTGKVLWEKARGILEGMEALPVVGQLVHEFVVQKKQEELAFKRNMRTRLKDVLHANMTVILETAIKSIDTYIWEYVEKQEGAFAVEIGKYNGLYKSAVEKQIQIEKENQAHVKEKIEKIKDDIILLNNRKFSINSIMEQLEKSKERGVQSYVLYSQASGT